MKNTISRLVGAACLLAGAASMPAAAIPVTSLVGATPLTAPAKNIFGTGPFNFAPGITWSSNGSDAAFGSTDGYGFNANGYWDYDKTLVATNDSTSSMTFTFDTAVSGFGGFLNWAPGSGEASIAAYDVNHALIESLVLSFLTDGSLNSGAFYGFQEGGSSIKYFTLTGAYIAGADFEVKAVPEPASMALSLLGLGLLGAMSRRKQKQA